ncbi:hypothetical protein RA262_28005, partial [Pseudomonas syringae pv. tagetis]
VFGLVGCVCLCGCGCGLFVFVVGFVGVLWGCVVGGLVFGVVVLVLVGLGGFGVVWFWGLGFGVGGVWGVVFWLLAVVAWGCVGCWRVCFLDGGGCGSGVRVVF